MESFAGRRYVHPSWEGPPRRRARKGQLDSRMAPLSVLEAHIGFAMAMRVQASGGDIPALLADGEWLRAVKAARDCDIDPFGGARAARPGAPGERDGDSGDDRGSGGSDSDLDSSGSDSGGSDSDDAQKAPLVAVLRALSAIHRAARR